MSVWEERKSELEELYKNGDTEKMLKIAQKLYRDGEPKGLYYLALAYQKRNELRKANDHFVKYLKEQPDDLDALDACMNCALDSQDYDLAIRMCQQMIRLGDSSSKVTLGELYYLRSRGLGDLKLTIDTLLEAGVKDHCSLDDTDWSILIKSLQELYRLILLGASDSFEDRQAKGEDIISINNNRVTNKMVKDEKRIFEKALEVALFADSVGKTAESSLIRCILRTYQAEELESSNLMLEAVLLLQFTKMCYTENTGKDADDWIFSNYDSFINGDFNTIFNRFRDSLTKLHIKPAFKELYPEGVPEALSALKYNAKSLESNLESVSFGKKLMNAFKHVVDRKNNLFSWGTFFCLGGFGLTATQYHPNLFLFIPAGIILTIIGIIKMLMKSFVGLEKIVAVAIALLLLFTGSKNLILAFVLLLAFIIYGIMNSKQF